MSGTVRGEIWLLGGSVCTGIALMMMYDGLRIFRWLVRHSSFWTGMEDAAYWLFASFATFRLLFGQNDGVLRGYAAVSYTHLDVYKRQVISVAVLLLQEIVPQVD